VDDHHPAGPDGRGDQGLLAKRDDPKDGLYDVFYFVPDPPLRFRIVVEADGAES